MKKNVIFIGGVHGVGKTTLCKDISSILNIEHYSSSELIAKLHKNNVRKDKIVEDVKINQNILIDAINEYIDKEEICLLDGHFCLINQNGLIEKIPEDTFKSIEILHIIVLVDDAKVISQRIQARDANSSYSSEFINNLQKCEINYAEYISKEINVKFDVIELNKDCNCRENFKDLVYKDLFK